MLSNWLTKSVARVVLGTYITQLFAPVISAMEDVERISHAAGFGHYQDLSPRGEAALQSSFQKALQSQLAEQQQVPSKPYSGWKKIVSPVQKDHEKALDILERFNQRAAFGRTASEQAEAFQYKLRLKTLDAHKDHIELKLSRKAKESTGAFECLHTATIMGGRVTRKFSPTAQAQEDELLNLFKGSSIDKLIYQDTTANFTWNVPGFGTLKIENDGTVFLDQDDDETPFLTSYDLILKTSGTLFIKSLDVANLSLKSPKTIIQPFGHVSADHLHVDQTLINNTGKIQTKHLTGPGRLINHGICNLEGTAENPAILGIQQVFNEKSNIFSFNPEIESSHLHITSANKLFLNKSDAEFRNTGTLVIDDSSTGSASFTNQGNVHLKESKINRKATNSGSWQANKMTVDGKSFTNRRLANLKIFDQLDINAHLHNEGDMEVTNLLNVKTVVNKGTIKGEVVDVRSDLLNEGGITVGDTLNVQNAVNQGTIKGEVVDVKSHLTNEGDMDVGALVVKTGLNKGKIRGNGLSIAVENEMINEGYITLYNHLFGNGVFKNHHALTFQGPRAFVNVKKLINQTLTSDKTATIKATTLIFNNNCNETLLNEIGSDIVVDKLEIIGTKDTSNQKGADLSSFQNLGKIRAKDLQINDRSLDNLGILNLSHLQADHSKIHNHKGGSLYVQGDTIIDDSHFQNDGHLQTEPNKHKERKFLQKSGELINHGTWAHRGHVDLGSTTLRNMGNILWQNGTWNSSSKDYTNIQGTWVFDQIICSQPIGITNYGTLQFDNSTFHFNLFNNHGTAIVEGGHYTHGHSC